MNYIDLFHGIGGFALGAHQAGVKFKNHFCSDIEPFAVKLYKKRFPDSIQLGDITKIKWEYLKKWFPGEWIITGGFPCQDISIAGKGTGFFDENGKPTRSGLWFEMLNAIRILQPKFVIAENVGAITFRGGPEVVASLASIGYDCEWQDIRARDMGAPHRRERIWFVAYSISTRRSKSLCINTKWKFKKSQQTNALDTQCNHFLQFKKRVGEPSVFGMDDGLPNRVDRLKGVGNAIFPQIAELLFRQLNLTPPEISIE